MNIIESTDQEIKPIGVDFYDKEKRKAYNKQYYLENRERVLTQMSTPVVCEHCFRKVSLTYLNKHQRSKLCHRWRNLDILLD
jgi:hypothetical protein